MEITELLKIAAWAFAGLSAVALIIVFAACRISGRISQAEQQLSDCFDEASS